ALRFAFKDLCDPEVHHLEDGLAPAIGGEKEVRGLEVAVDHASFVRLIEGIRKVLDHDANKRGRKRSTLCDDSLDRLALEGLHREKGHLSLLIDAGVEDVNDVGVLPDPPAYLGFAYEEVDERSMGDKVRMDELERARLARRRMPRPVDRGHAALPEKGLDVV